MVRSQERGTPPGPIHTARNPPRNPKLPCAVFGTADAEEHLTLEPGWVCPLQHVRPQKTIF